MDQLQLVSAGGNAFSGGLPVAWSATGAFPQLVSLNLSGSSLSGVLHAAVLPIMPIRRAWRGSAWFFGWFRPHRNRDY